MSEVHILKLPPTTTKKEEEQLSKLNKKELAYLGRRVCAACEWPLNRSRCGSVYDACPEKTRIERRSKCLAGYKPRCRG